MPTNTLITINQALYSVIQPLIDPKNEGHVDIRFDMPDVNSTPANATLSIFLYDVHEDLQLRQSESGRFLASTKNLAPKTVHINCNYLITWWPAQEKSQDGNGPESQPDSDSMHMMNAVLRGLLNNRQLPDLPGAYTRIVPPQESLNSLGNYWQSLGNRPRLSFTCSITAPFSLDDSPEVSMVSEISSKVSQATVTDNATLSNLLRQQLIREMGGTEEIQTGLARLQLETETDTTDPAQIALRLTLTGPVAQSLEDKLSEAINNWENQSITLPEINGVTFTITDTDTAGVIYV